VKDVGANYWSLWNWHNIHAEHVMNYYRQYPEGIDHLSQVIGYRIRPAWIWLYEGAPHMGLIVGLANDGISGVPGTVRLSLCDANGRPIADAVLEPGHPVPHQVRLARLELLEGTNWEGARLRAELIVKGLSHPLRWACRESLNPDGSITLTRNQDL
jgi:hypothetical protein